MREHGIDHQDWHGVDGAVMFGVGATPESAFVASNRLFQNKVRAECSILADMSGI